MAQPVTLFAPASSATDWSAPLGERGCVVDGGDGDRERLGGARVVPTARGTPVVGDVHRDRRRAVGVRGGGVGEGARGSDGRLDAEQRVRVVGDAIRRGLAGLVGAATWRLGRERRDGLRARVLGDGPVATDRQDRLVVDGGDCDRECLRRRRVVAAIRGTAAVRQEDLDVGRPGGVESGGVGERAVGRDDRLDGEQLSIVGLHVERQCLAALVDWTGRDRGRPAGHRPGACVLGDGLVRALGERGCVVDRRDGDRELLGR